MALNHYNYFRTSERSSVEGPLILHRADCGGVLCNAGGLLEITVDWHLMCFINQISSESYLFGHFSVF